MSYVLGLDIGVASVGWGIVDKESLEIIDAGVRLFDSADANKNIERRTFRQIKRLIRRKQNRLLDLKKNFKSLNFIMNRQISNTLELRNKGLIDKLEKDEIVAVILNIAKRRGISYLEDSIDDDTSAETIEQNKIALVNKLPCQIQLDRLNNYGKYRGVIKVDEKENLNNIFTTSSYKKEAELILRKQQEYYKELDNEFINKILEGITRKRKYYIGPGNIKSRTDYGIYRKNGQTLDNLFEILIGKCSIYPNETRAASASYSAQEFNFLNDINNIRINKEGLTKEEKLSLMDCVKNAVSMGSKTLHKEIAKRKNCHVSEISGNRIDRKEEPEYHTFETYREFKKVFLENDINIDELEISLIDELARVLTINTEKEGILEEFEKNNILLNANFNEKLIDDLCLLRRKKSTLFSKWHSLSVKAIREIRQELIDSNKNQSAIFHEMGKFKTNIEKFEGLSSLPYKEIVKDIYNPIARRSVVQTIKVTNALIKKYGAFADIVIEMPREFEAEEEQKKKNKKAQLDNENRLKKIIEKVKDEYGLEIKGHHFKNNKNLSLKLKLWEQQDGKCIYSGKNIGVNELVYNGSLFEIDHIIPISISFDDSQNNKVLVYSSENQKKGNNTPFKYITSADNHISYEEYKNMVKLLKHKNKISINKMNNLLFEKDINKYDVLKSFINRNLNDTKYASRVVLKSFQDFFKAQGNDTKVKVIKGAYTSQYRKRLRLKKDRDDSYSHHGIDSLICAFSILGLNQYLKEYMNLAIVDDRLIDMSTGEVINEGVIEDQLKESGYNDIISNYTSFEITKKLSLASINMKYSHKVDRKVNRGISNQTIYSTRKINETHIVVEKRNIYDDKDFEVIKKIITMEFDKGIDAKNSSILLRQHDNQTFEKFVKVIETYPDVKNPFIKFKEEHGGFRKYSKRGNGPFVNELKILGKELGSHIDISHKYQSKDKKVVLKGLNPLRADVYYDKNKEIFRIIGIKHSDLRYENGNYVLNIDDYISEMVREQVIEKPEEYDSKIGKDIVFKFSLYKNDLLIMGENKDDSIEYRFLSRTMPNTKNYIEVKPVDKSKFEVPQKLLGITKKIKYMKKINTNILGDKHYISNEQFKLDFNIE